MPTLPSSQAGVARSLLVAWMATATSTLAHAGSGGPVPGALGTAVLVTVLAVAVLPLTPRALSMRRAASMLLVLQVVVHVASMMMAAARVKVSPATPQLAAALGADHQHHAAPVTSVGVAASTHASHVGADGMGLMDLFPSVPMLLAHVIAAAALGWAIAAGEQSARVAINAWSQVLDLARALRPGHVVRVAQVLLASLAPTARSRRRPGATARWDSTSSLRSLWAPCTATRRGPPQLLFA